MAEYRSDYLSREAAFALNVTAPGATTWQWSPAAGLICTTCQNPTATPSVNTNYIVIASDGVCSGTDTVAISLYPQPVATAGPNAIICLGSDTLLSSGGGVSYAWSPPAGLSCIACQAPSANPVTTTTYTVTITDVNGCAATNNTTITVIDTLHVDAN